ncbi:MAG: sigma-54 dependent transcriptional regulator [Gammaproteobacteria bacterium]|nr:sigma-54 dependent transcriptional regulator [Gammaproteobacteria bacterium]
MADEKILVVDDEPDIQAVIKEILEDENYTVVTAANGEGGRKAQIRHQPDLVLLDIWMPDIDGISLLRRWHEQNLDMPVVMISGHGNVETAVEAVRYGAYDFLEKPLSTAKLLVTVERALQHRRLKRENRELRNRLEPNHILVGGSAVMQKLRDQIERIARTESRVLISGEAGSGKGVAARCLHQASRRSQALMVEFNLAAVPPQSLAAQFFGSENQHGAVQPGRFEQAAGGTLFLDEIGDLDPGIQTKLVNALEKGRFVRVGGREENSINVRIISSTNHDLARAVQEGRFREDLYYRLNVVPLRIPPLREHPEDIPELADFYLEWFASSENLPPRSLTEGAVEALCGHHWPGNVRELVNLVQQLLILNRGGEIHAGEVRAAIRLATAAGEGGTLAHDWRPGALGEVLDQPLRSARGDFERLYLIHQLRKARNVTEAARNVGLERTHLYHKLKQLGLRLSQIRNDDGDDEGNGADGGNGAGGNGSGRR